MRLCVIAFLLASCCALVAEDALMELKPEMVRLAKKYPLRTELKVIVIGHDVYGWYRPASRTGNEIIIIDKGKTQNVRTLRHEWMHAVQEQEGRAFDEKEAEKAEDERQK